MRVDHRLRFLRRGGVVQIDERLAVNLLAKDGKVGANFFHVECERRFANRRAAVAGEPDAIARCSFWRRWSSHFLQISFGVGVDEWRARTPADDCAMVDQMCVDQLLDVRARRAFLHAVEAFARERHEQQAARGDFVDAAGAQIEKRVFLDLADGRAVRAFHVVGVDFELRLGVDLRLIGKQQVAIGLLGVGFLRVLVDDDAAMENAVRTAVENAVVELAAAAVRLACSTSM